MFRMVGPIRLPNGTFQLNVRVPRNKLERLRGAHVRLPISDEQVVVKAGEKIVVSLRTQDPKEARKRFVYAYSALQTFFDSGPLPQTLTHSGTQERSAESKQTAIADFSGLLVKQSGQGGLVRKTQSARQKQTTATNSLNQKRRRETHVDSITVDKLFTTWQKATEHVVAPSTARRYKPSLNSLSAFLKNKAIECITQDDIWSWAEYRRDHEKIAPSTVNRNDLVAAASIFTFATTRDGGRLIQDNPVTGVRLLEPRRVAVRERFFKMHEVRSILLLARTVEVRGAYKRQAASRRWVPWICAYSGARVQEPLWLRKEDIACDEETQIWIMRFPQTKTGYPRTVPVHQSLIDEGFLDYVKNAEPGYLFVDDNQPRRGVSRSIQEQRASQIAEWIKKNIALEAGVDPNHGWRHTFVTRATSKIEERIQHAICGHNTKRNAADGYFTPTIWEMKKGLDAYPPFDLRVKEGVK